VNQKGDIFSVVNYKTLVDHLEMEAEMRSKLLLWAFLVIPCSFSVAMRSQVCIGLESAYTTAVANANYYWDALEGAIIAEDLVAIAEITDLLSDEIDIIEATENGMHASDCYEP